MQKRETQLAGLMDRVFDAVRRADFAALPALTEAMANVEGELAKVDSKSLARLRAKAERNAGAILAARRGIRAARRRIDDVMNASRGFSSYDRTGRKVVETEDRALTKRF